MTVVSASPWSSARQPYTAERFAGTAAVLLLANYLCWLVAPGTFLSSACLLMMVLAIVAFIAREVRDGRYLFALVVIGGFFLLFFSPLKDWDARSIWFLHAKRMYFDGSLLARLDNYPVFAHAAYPDLIPAVAASVARTFGVWNEYLPKTALVIALAPPFAILLAAPASRMAKLLMLGSILYLTRTQLLNGSMDGPLSVYVAAAAVLIGKVRRSENFAHATVALVLLAATAGIKNEGLVMAAIVGLPLVLSLLRRPRSCPRLARLLVAGLAAGIPLAIWAVQTRLAGIDNGLLIGDPWNRAMDRFLSHDVISILRSLWDASWLAIAGLLVVAVLCQRLDRPTVWFVCAYLAVLFGVYVATPYDLAWYMSTSVARVTLVIKVLIAAIAILQLDAAVRSDGVRGGAGHSPAVPGS